MRDVFADHLGDNWLFDFLTQAIGHEGSCICIQCRRLRAGLLPLPLGKDRPPGPPKRAAMKWEMSK